ncbi:cytochrome c-type biogenesis protein [Halobacillus karajensis]|uniref:Thiol:disulfide interchange protein n=1 Tax=Halobacillus karajensis TaxID=195088 RepID=A0A024P2E9_9BACI|nr:cytochrome c biogenesis CcdA family protein [Halobacillus karajensis]CDQ19631.1 thiol:disulfide interchange protein precursor [Halobacillus karajensis]CDQ22091.1 thiol:disulfide interchange protein precursor [Halobacillus karajensis]CDQ27932.1 thiol:disulfide interchange protein precursor [Halobacillus karajensis]SEH79228.1 cytochrome c-type biogenesis protein [Halobacillus karajensis]
MDVNLFLAFGAGFLSFISPCVFPLYPAFLSYITGMSVNELKEDNGMLRRASLIHTILFLLGFTTIFIILGFSGSLFAQFFIQNESIIRRLGAILIIFFGFVIIGVFNFNFLMKDRKIIFKNRPSGYIGTFIIGLTFSLGWTPCTGPILAAVLSLAADSPELFFVTMLAYSLGFSIPFLILSFFVGKLNWIKKHSASIVKVGGYVMILVGVALYFDWMTMLTSYLAGFFDFQGF